MVGTGTRIPPHNGRVARGKATKGTGSKSITGAAARAVRIKKSPAKGRFLYGGMNFLDDEAFEPRRGLSGAIEPALSGTIGATEQFSGLFDIEPRLNSLISDGMEIFIGVEFNKVNESVDGEVGQIDIGGL